MKAYAYTAYTDAGRRKSGTVVAETEADASAQLAKQDLFVSEIAETSTRATKSTLSLTRRSRLNADLQSVFTRQMAVLLGAELTAEAALEAVRSGSQSALDTVAAQARASLMEGATLSDALAGTGAGFPPYYLAALKAGEDAGELATVFQELADHLEQLGSEKAEIATALIYPGFVAAVALLVCAILMTSVAPEIVSMFELSGRPLPPLTQYVLAVSDWVQANAYVILAVLAALTALALVTPRVPARQGRTRQNALAPAHHRAPDPPVCRCAIHAHVSVGAGRAPRSAQRGGQCQRRPGC